MKKAHGINRRDFIRQTAVAAGALSLGRNLFAGADKSMVLEVHRPGIIGRENRPDFTGVLEMLDRGMQDFTGEKTRAGQWKRFVSPEYVVGLKVNGLGGPFMATKHELIRAVIVSLTDAGIKPGNIIVFDRYRDHLKAVVQQSRLEDLGVRVISSEDKEGGFEEKETVYGSASTHLTKILTEKITAMINMPIVKDHQISGTTVSLKNLSHGLTDKPWEFHANHCDPYIAHVNAMPEIVKKHRLVIMDGLLGCCDGGPGHRPEGVVKYESLLFATDRVAIDTVATEKIEAARKQKGFPSLAAAGRPPQYLLTAEKVGLGHHDRTGIDHRIIE